MNGHILPGTCIAVDFWKIRGVENQLIHFLTHLHGDHIVGLTATWSRPIYCSEFTAQFLEAHYGVSKSLMNVLHINQCTLVKIPDSMNSFCVTAFDANHCPGALMLYFEGTFGNIFYTGDFRFSSEMNENLHNLFGKVDKLYLDNTFCSQECVFPSREECQKKIVEIVKDHPDSDVIIGIRKLGKESMLALLGVELNETVFVSPERYQISQCLFDCNIFAVAAKDQKTRIKTLPLHSITRELLYKKNEIRPTIAIMPTAIFTGLSCKPFSRDPNIFVVPYSDHSSFPELVEFVKKLQPQRIIPIVTHRRGPFGKDISHRSDMSILESLIRSNETSTHCSQPKSNISEEKPHNDPISSKVSSLSKQATAVDKNYGEKFFSMKGSLVSCENILASTPSLKRKVSLPNKRKRKIAKGVIFNEDLEKKRHVSVGELNSGDSDTSQNVICGENNTRNSNSLSPSQMDDKAVKKLFSFNDNSFQSVGDKNSIHNATGLPLDNEDFQNEGSQSNVDGNICIDGISSDKTMTIQEVEERCLEDEAIECANDLQNDNTKDTLPDSSSVDDKVLENLIVLNQGKSESSNRMNVVRCPEDEAIGCAIDLQYDNTKDTLPDSSSVDDKVLENLIILNQGKSESSNCMVEERCLEDESIKFANDLQDNNIKNTLPDSSSVDEKVLENLIVLEQGDSESSNRIVEEDESIECANDFQNDNTKHTLPDSSSVDDRVFENLIVLEHGDSESSNWMVAEEYNRNECNQDSLKPAYEKYHGHNLFRSAVKIRDSDKDERCQNKNSEKLTSKALPNSGSSCEVLSYFNISSSGKKKLNKCGHVSHQHSNRNSSESANSSISTFTSSLFTRLRKRGKNEEMQNVSLRQFFENGNSIISSKFNDESDFRSALAKLM